MLLLQIVCKKTNNNLIIEDVFFDKVRVWLAYKQFFDFGIRLEKVRTAEFINLPEKDKTKFFHEFYSKVDDMVGSGLITDGYVYFCMQSLTNGHTDSDTCSDILSVFRRNKEDILTDFGKNIDIVINFYNLLKDCVEYNSELEWSLWENSTV